MYIRTLQTEYLCFCFIGGQKEIRFQTNELFQWHTSKLSNFFSLPFFSCPPLLLLCLSLVKHPRASSCLWTSANWMSDLGRVLISYSWYPLSPFATKSIPRAPFSTYHSAPSWTSSLKSSLSLRASWRPPVRGFPIPSRLFSSLPSI